VKQMMTLNPTDLFEKCIIKTNSKPKIQSEPEEKEKEELLVNNVTLTSLTLNEVLEEDSKIEEKATESNDLGLNDILDEEEEEEEKEKESVSSEPDVEEPIVDIGLENEIIEDSLAEFNLDLETVPETETVQLKPRTDVYYEMYRTAKRKAKMAKNLALKSYLEAKNIKSTYMLGDVSDTDSDEYDEMDEDGFLENLEKED